MSLPTGAKAYVQELLPGSQTVQVGASMPHGIPPTYEITRAADYG
jgi:hypothetical protein